MTDELKPCPFCGGTVLRTGGDDKIVGVSCLRCQACGPNHYGQHEWNDRADTPSPTDSRGEVLTVFRELVAAIDVKHGWHVRATLESALTAIDTPAPLQNVVARPEVAGEAEHAKPPCHQADPLSDEPPLTMSTAAGVSLASPASPAELSVGDGRIAPMPAAEIAKLKTAIEARWAGKPWYQGGDDPMNSPGCMMRAQEILALIAAAERPSAPLQGVVWTDDDDIGPHEKALRDAVEPFLDWLEQREEGAHIQEVREGLIGVEDVIPDDKVVLGAHLRAQKDQGVLTIGHFRRLQAAYDGKVSPPPSPHVMGVWRPIERADKSTDRVYDFPGMPRPIGNSEEYWCRDADGLVFLATWADDGKRAYWWDLDGESPVDPVEFMPHPLDPRFHPDAKLEDQP